MTQLFSKVNKININTVMLNIIAAVTTGKKA